MGQQTVLCSDSGRAKYPVSTLVSPNGAWSADSCSHGAEFFIQKQKWLPSGLFISYQQVATIRLEMDEELIFHLIPRYIIYAMHIVHLIEVQGEKKVKQIYNSDGFRRKQHHSWLLRPKTNLYVLKCELLSVPRRTLARPSSGSFWPCFFTGVLWCLCGPWIVAISHFSCCRKTLW